MAGGQSVLQQAVRLLRGAALPGDDDQETWLEELLLDWHTVKELEKAVHARATPPRRDARAEGHRHRRDLHPQGPHLPHRGQRPGAAPADLVRRQDRSEASMDGFYHLARAAKKCRASAWQSWTCGSRFAIPPSSARTQGEHPVRQVPHPAPPRATPWIPCARRNTRGWLGTDRRFIKGQKYTLLLPSRENLTLEGKRQPEARCWQRTSG